MRKAKGPVDDDAGDAHYFDELEPQLEDGDDIGERDPLEQRRPARQRVELRNEQQSLRRQLSDWDDYDADLEQDGFDTKL